ncbi:MAG: LamG-like jellyroll fold domain-containing protein [Planctomycetia bacterium]|nr:LamG-like jellyroll fold domain-containing protein [Planctomycetia bacterium]
MTKTTDDPDLLIAHYLSDSLTDVQAEQFLALVTSNAEIAGRFRDNILIDFLLQEQGEIQIKEEKFRLASRSTAESSEPSWDELVRLQNAERPISAIVEEYRQAKAARRANLYSAKTVLRFAQKCFWPSRHDFEESVAPVVTLLVVLLVLVTTTFVIIEHSLRPEPRERITTLARVNETIDAVWEKSSPSYKRGQLVNSSSFRLQSGLVQLEMNNGTTLILEGPAELTLSDAMNAFCQSGKVSVHVPKAGHGYELDTPFGSVIDRGTEFFVDVSDATSTVQTVKGKIDFISSANEIFSLFANQTIKIDAEKAIKPTSGAIHNSYYNKTAFDLKVQEQTKEILHERTESNAFLTDDPSLLVRFSFNEPWRKTIDNLAPEGRKLCPSAQITGTKKVEGSLANTTAVQFSDAKDKLQFYYPGQYNDLTVVAVVKLDGNLHLDNILLSSWNNDNEQAGHLLWQITRLGFLKVQLSKKDNFGSDAYESAQFYRKPTRGIWCCLTVVFDSQQKKIRYYVDNRVISTSDWDNPQPIVLGDTVIGNTLERATATDRYFNGCMEEIMIFGRALSETEVRRYKLY